MPIIEKMAEVNMFIDNMFILQDLSASSAAFKSSLFVFFVAFYSIWTYQSSYFGWNGHVIDTFKNLFDKLAFPVKNNRDSLIFFSKLVVNQGRAIVS